MVISTVTIMVMAPWFGFALCWVGCANNQTTASCSLLCANTEGIPSVLAHRRKKEILTGIRSLFQINKKIGQNPVPVPVHVGRIGLA